MYKGKSILILLREPDEIVEVGFVNTHSETHQASLRIEDAPELKIGDRFETDEATYVVHSEPIKMSHNLVWSCDLICV